MIKNNRKGDWNKLCKFLKEIQQNDFKVYKRNTKLKSQEKIYIQEVLPFIHYISTIIKSVWFDML